MAPFHWHNELFVLHPSRCMFWETEQTLILSDLHLGKTGHFRKEGIAIPQQVYQNDLNRLFSTIQYFKPKEILLVGDLFHSRANKEWDWFAKWRSDVGHIQFTLILGNHDRLPTGLADALDLQVENSFSKGKFRFLHDECNMQDDNGLTSGLICGHVHPAVSIPTSVRQSVRLPCFHFTPTTCTLPAFSLFTGNHTIKPKAHDAVFAITGNEIIRV